MTGSYGSGSDFGADCFRILLAGEVHLPDTARLYESAAWSVHDVGPALESVARTLQHPAGFALIERARDVLEAAFARTATNVDEVADALVILARDIQATDAAAAEEFAEQWAQLAPETRAAIDAPDTDPEPPT